MLQADLYRDISRVTGETVATIKRVGFLIADPSEPISDPEAENLGPHVLDWDEMDFFQDQTDAEYPIDFSLA
jgi:hypothetical protein